MPQDTFYTEKADSNSNEDMKYEESLTVNLSCDKADSFRKATLSPESSGDEVSSFAAADENSSDGCESNWSKSNDNEGTENFAGEVLEITDQITETSLGDEEETEQSSQKPGGESSSATITLTSEIEILKLVPEDAESGNKAECERMALIIEDNFSESKLADISDKVVVPMDSKNSHNETELLVPSIKADEPELQTPSSNISDDVRDIKIDTQVSLESRDKYEKAENVSKIQGKLLTIPTDKSHESVETSTREKLTFSNAFFQPVSKRGPFRHKKFDSKRIPYALRNSKSIDSASNIPKKSLDDELQISSEVRFECARYPEVSNPQYSKESMAHIAGSSESSNAAALQKMTLTDGTDRSSEIRFACANDDFHRLENKEPESQISSTESDVFQSARGNESSKAKEKYSEHTGTRGNPMESSKRDHTKALTASEDIHASVNPSETSPKTSASTEAKIISVDASSSTDDDQLSMDSVIATRKQFTRLTSECSSQSDVFCSHWKAAIDEAVAIFISQSREIHRARDFWRGEFRKATLPIKESSCPGNLPPVSQMFSTLDCQLENLEAGFIEATENAFDVMDVLINTFRNLKPKLELEDLLEEHLIKTALFKIKLTEQRYLYKKMVKHLEGKHGYESILRVFHEPFERVLEALNKTENAIADFFVRRRHGACPPIKKISKQNPNGQYN